MKHRWNESLARWWSSIRHRDGLDRESESRFSALMRELPALLYVREVGPTGRWLYVGPQIEFMLGFREDELKANPGLWQDHIHVDDRDRVMQEWIRCRETHVPLHTQYRMIDRAGNEISVRNNAIIIPASQPPELYQGIVFDVTEIKRAEEGLHREFDQMAALTRISRGISAVDDLPGVLSSIARFAAELLESDASGVFLAGPDDHLHIAASYGVRDEFVKALNSQGIAPGMGAIGRAALERRPVAVEDVESDRSYSLGHFARMESIRAILAVPMTLGDRVIGGIVLWHRKPRKFSPSETSFLQAIAQQCVNAVENARLFQAEREQRLLAQALRDTAEVVSRASDPDQVLDRIFESMEHIVPHDAGNIMLFQGDVARVVRHGGYNPRGQKTVTPSDYAVHRFAGFREMLNTKQPFVVLDTFTDSRWEQRAEIEWIRSHVAAPILVKGKVVGFLNLDSAEAGFFNSTHGQYLHALANQAAIAIENAHLFAETAQRSERLGTLNRISRAVSTTLTMDELLGIVYREISAIIPLDAFFIALYDRDSAELDFRLLVDRQVYARPERVPLADDLTAFVVHSKRPLRILDFEKERDRLPTAALWGSQESPASWLGVPMLMNEQVVGVISVQSYRPNTYGEAEEELLSTIADTVSIALERARLFEEAARRARQLTVLNAAAIQVQQSFDTFQILRAASDTVRRIGTFAHVVLIVEDAQLEHLHTSMSKELLREFVGAFGDRRFEFRIPVTAVQEEWERLTAGEAIVKTGLLDRIVDQLAGESRIIGNWILEKSHETASLVAPLTRADKTFGLMIISGEQLGESDLPAVALFARHISVALDNARLFQEIQQELNERKNAEAQIQRQLRRLAALHSIDTAISSSLDLRVTFEVILDQVMSQLHTDAADILLLNPFLQMLQFAAGRGFRSRAYLRNDLPLGRGLAGRAALERKLIHVPNLDNRADDLVGSLRQANEDFVTYHALPLIAKGEVKGVLEIFHRARFEPDQEWSDFLETLAAQAAIAIDNMALFDTLQRSNTELSLAYDTTLEGWSHALEMRDRETEGHTLRVADETVRLAKAMGMDDADLVHIRRGALLHDIGKMGIPDNILLKPGPLNEDEWKIMRNHPTFAYELLAPIAYLRPAIDIPYCHHEKWDGTGYPRQLEREQIPLAARIFAVVDIWDALSSERPYRGGWREDRVRDYIRSISGTHLDPRVVEAFLNLEATPASS